MNIARGWDDPTDLGHAAAPGLLADALIDPAPADPAGDPGIEDPMFDLGGDERRMHVRAYNHWVSLLKGRPYPTIADLDPDRIVDFGEHSVLLDFSRGIDDPAIAFLGRALRDECGLGANIGRIADVPSRSLLSRLTDHYLQIIANRAPIGFEAEFVGIRGRNTLYRGILMPFSSSGDAIDFIYGVINWKETVDAATQAGLDAELGAAVRAGPRSTSDAPVWADGPGAAHPDEAATALDAPVAAPVAAPVDVSVDATFDAETDTPMVGSLADRLALARESAAAVRAADTRSRAALYRALARAHDFGLAADADAGAFAALVAVAGLTMQQRAPLTPVVKLVFGADYDKTRVTEFAAVLAHARRHGVGSGELPGFLDGHAGGIKAVVAAERQARKPASAAPAGPTVREPIGHLSLDVAGEAGTAVVLIARVAAHGGLDLLGTVVGDDALSERALRSLA